MKSLTVDQRKKQIADYKNFLETLWDTNEEINNENAPDFIKESVGRDWIKNQYELQKQRIFKKIDEFDEELGDQEINEMTFIDHLNKLVEDEFSKIENETLK